MAKKIASVLKLQIPAGAANPSPPVGPALGQAGVNIMDFCNAFNAETQNSEKGMPLPVVISVFEDKSFTFVVKTPPATFEDYLNETKYKYDLAEKVLEWSNGMIKDPMTSMHKLPYHLVKDYAEQDTNLTLKLWELFEKKYLDAVLYTKTNPGCGEDVLS